jgi:hypothetical protein
MFDPYHRWLGIPPGQRPPTYYQLLGIAPDEADLEVIKEAAVRQTSHVRLYQTGPYAAQCTAILNEIGQARAVLLNPDKRRQYDASVAPPPGPLPPPPVPVPIPLAGPPPAGKRGGLPLRGSPLLPALAYAALLLIGAGLAFGLGLGRSAAPAESPPRPTPTPPPAPAPAPAPAPRPEVAKVLEGHDAALAALAVSADGLSLFSAGGASAAGTEGEPLGCVLRRWDQARGRPLRLVGEHHAPIHCLALSPDGKQVLTGGGGYDWHDGAMVLGDCVIRLWDAAGGTARLTFTEHEAPVRGVAFLPDGHGVVSCSSDGTVLLWDTRRRPLPRPLTHDPTPAECVAVSPSGRFVLVGGRDGQLRLFDLPFRQEILDRFQAVNVPVHAVAFSPNGRRVATAGGTVHYGRDKAVPEGCVVHVWDFQSGHLRLELTGHTRPIRSVAFRNDGQLIASGALDGTVRLWQASNGQPLRVLDAGSGVTCLAVTARDQVVAGTVAGAIRIWDLGRDLVPRRGKP